MNNKLLDVFGVSFLNIKSSEKLDYNIYINGISCNSVNMRMLDDGFKVLEYPINCKRTKILNDSNCYLFYSNKNIGNFLYSIFYKNANVYKLSFYETDDYLFIIQIINCKKKVIDNILDTYIKYYKDLFTIIKVFDNICNIRFNETGDNIFTLNSIENILCLYDKIEHIRIVPNKSFIRYYDCKISNTKFDNNNLVLTIYNSEDTIKLINTEHLCCIKVECDFVTSDNLLCNLINILCNNVGMAEIISNITVIKNSSDNKILYLLLHFNSDISGSNYANYIYYNENIFSSMLKNNYLFVISNYNSIVAYNKN